jgi:hypothetical protein
MVKERSSRSRREVLLNVGSIGAASTLIASANPSGRQAPTKYATAFALVGDRYHNSDYIRTALTRTLEEEAGLSIDFTDEVKLLNAENLSHYKLLIMLKDGMIWPDGYGGGSYPGYRDQPLISDPPLPKGDAKPKFWMTPAQGKAVKEFVENGGSTLFYHNTTHTALTNPDFADVLGATYDGHPPVRPFKVSVVNPDHPITRGVRDYIVTDEQHYFKYLKDDKYALTRSTDLGNNDFGKYGPSIHGGWAYDYGRGRNCYLAQGHMISVLWNPEYKKLQKNAVKWLLRET